MWYFLSPKIVFGEDALQELSALQGRKAFIVTDATIEALGYVDKVREQLSYADIQTHTFAEVEPDPSLNTVRRCAEQVIAYAPDWVIGLGGGSCLDAAKAAWFLYECPETELDAINPFETFGLRAKARFATISTTSGTGADVSWGFALNDTANQSKLVRVSRELIPDLAIVDPVFVHQLPAQVTADSGMDVLAHAVEAYSNNWHNDFSDAMAIKATQLVFEYLPRAFNDGSDQEAREHMHNAATMAGLAFGNTAIIIAHSLAHAAGARFKVHHGKIVGLFLPYTIEYNALEAASRYAELAQALQLTGFGADAGPEEATSLLVAAIRDFAAGLQQPTRLSELGIPPAEFKQALPELVANVQASLELLANPRQPDSTEIENLFRYAYEGRSIDF